MPSGWKCEYLARNYNVFFCAKITTLFIWQSCWLICFGCFKRTPVNFRVRGQHTHHTHTTANLHMWRRGGEWTNNEGGVSTNFCLRSHLPFFSATPQQKIVFEKLSTWIGPWNPSQDSSVGSISAWYREVLGSKPGKGKNY